MSLEQDNKVNDYSEKSIRILKGLQPVKQRPGMYTLTDCPLHIIQEVIDNATDEVLANFANRIILTEHADGSISVEDNGRGIPVGIHPEEKVPVVEIVFTRLHAGGKFDKGTGGRPDLVERKFEAEAPNRLHVADIAYVRMANGSFGYTAFADGVYARRIVGWACAMTMNTQEPPLQALGQAISRAASRGGTDGLIRHGDHGTQYTGTVYATGVMEYGMLPSTGTVGDPYGNAMAESADGAYKTELVWRRKPFTDLKDPELATFRWVSWWNSKRLHQSLGCRTPEQIETEYHANQAAQAVSQ